MNLGYQFGIEQVRGPDFDRFKNILLTLMQASREIPPGTAVVNFSREHPTIARSLEDVGATYRIATGDPVIITEEGKNNPFVDAQFNQIRYAAINPGKNRLAVAFNGLFDFNHFSSEANSLEQLLSYGVQPDEPRKIKRTDLIDFTDIHSRNWVFSLEKDRIKLNVEEALLNTSKREDYLEAVATLADYFHREEKTFKKVITIKLHHFSPILKLINPQIAKGREYVEKVIQGLDLIAEKGLEVELGNPLGEGSITGYDLVREVANGTTDLIVDRKKIAAHIKKIVAYSNGSILFGFNSEIDRSELGKRLGPITEYSISGGPFRIDIEDRELSNAIKTKTLIQRRVPGCYLLRGTPDKNVELSLAGERIVSKPNGEEVLRLTKSSVIIPPADSTDPVRRRLAVSITGEIYNQMLLQTYSHAHHANGETYTSSLRQQEIDAIRAIYQETEQMMNNPKHLERPSTIREAVRTVQNRFIESLAKQVPI